MFITKKLFQIFERHQESRLDFIKNGISDLKDRLDNIVGCGKCGALVFKDTAISYCPPGRLFPSFATEYYCQACAVASFVGTKKEERSLEKPI